MKEISLLLEKLLISHPEMVQRIIYTWVITAAKDTDPQKLINVIDILNAINGDRLKVAQIFFKHETLIFEKILPHLFKKEVMKTFVRANNFLSNLCQAANTKKYGKFVIECFASLETKQNETSEQLTASVKQCIDNWLEHLDSKMTSRMKILFKAALTELKSREQSGEKLNVREKMLEFVSLRFLSKHIDAYGQKFSSEPMRRFISIKVGSIVLKVLGESGDKTWQNKLFDRIEKLVEPAIEHKKHTSHSYSMTKADVVTFEAAYEPALEAMKSDRTFEIGKLSSEIADLEDQKCIILSLYPQASKTKLTSDKKQILDVRVNKYLSNSKDISEQDKIENVKAIINSCRGLPSYYSPKYKALEQEVSGKKAQVELLLKPVAEFKVLISKLPAIEAPVTTAAPVTTKVPIEEQKPVAIKRARAGTIDYSSNMMFLPPPASSAATRSPSPSVLKRAKEESDHSSSTSAVSPSKKLTRQQSSLFGSRTRTQSVEKSNILPPPPPLVLPEDNAINNAPLPAPLL